MRLIWLVLLIGALAEAKGLDVEGLQAELQEIINLMDRNEIPVAPPLPVDDNKCREEADVAFVLDASSSIAPEDYDAMKDFVKKIIRSFDVSQDMIRVAIISFNRYSQVDLYLDQSKGTYVATKAVNDIRPTGTGTFTNKALAMTRMVFVPSVGGRPKIPKIVIVLTDGRSNNEEATLTEARKLRASGAIVFCIGVGRWVSDEELQVIATKPASKFAYRLESFDGLKDIKNLLQKETCKTIIKPPPPIPECSPAIFDIVFIMDASSSILPEGFQQMKNFIDMFMSSFEISPKFTRFGLVTFNLWAKIEFGLDTFDSYFPMKKALAQAEQGQTGTYTHRALDKARKDLFPVRREDDKEPSKVVILLTDGKSRKPEETVKSADKLKADNVILFTIGVGKTKITELITIVSEPADTHNFQVENFDDLKSIFRDLLKETCIDVPENNAMLPPKPVETPIVDVCDGVIDVFFMFEIPEMDEDFTIVRKYLNAVFSRLQIVEDKIRVAVSLYSKSTFSIATFDDFKSISQLKALLKKFELPENRQPSFKKAFGMFDDLKSLGWRRNGVPKVMVSGFIDNPNDDAKPDVLEIIKKLKTARFTSIAINMGMPWEEGTMLLASRPKQLNAIYVPRMNALKNTVDAVVTQICSAVDEV